MVQERQETVQVLERLPEQVLVPETVQETVQEAALASR